MNILSKNITNPTQDMPQITPMYIAKSVYLYIAYSDSPVNPAAARTKTIKTLSGVYSDVIIERR